MNKTFVILLLSILCFCMPTGTQAQQKSELQQRAENEDAKGNIANARSLFIHAFNDYATKGQIKQGVECGVKATALYYKENFYQEAFELLRRIDQAIIAADKTPDALHYLTSKERLQMYIKMHRSESAMDQLKLMESRAAAANDESVTNDLLYNKAIYYYTFGQTAKGDAVFKEMAAKLTSQKEYDKVDQVYQTLIANGRKSNNASLVAQSYSSYIVWKDSVNALKRADEIGALQQQIADNEAAIAEKDSSLTSRQLIITSLGILAIALAAVLVFGAIVLLRYIALTRKQKKTIRLANETNALKAKFISNISAQLTPTLQQLDSSLPAVKALQDFSSHIQTLSELESGDAVADDAFEEVQVSSFCESLIEQVRPSVKADVVLKVNAPKLSASIHKSYVSHILLHLLHNAAEYTPEGGHISLEYKKRSAHKFQFLVTNTGCGIPEDKREDVFKPFVEIKDLKEGDGLGLPICKQMALKMNGDLDIDSDYSKGTRFVLDLYA